MKRILFALLISIISLGNISCKAQDNIAWVQNDVAYENINYGALYNWWAATDSRKITSSDDWAVPSQSDFEDLVNYLGGDQSIVGGKLKEIGFIHWNSPNTGATDEVGFGARGSSIRYEDGSFITDEYDGLKKTCEFWTSTVDTTGTINMTFPLYYNSAECNTTGAQEPYNVGISIRLLYTGAGTPTSYKGNDGKVYRVVTIGTQTWLADNLAETKYRDGSDIPQVTDNTAWSLLTTGAWCYYNNDPTKK